MDIPNSGAIFTLGKSYLADNNQSYFYIKKDPVKRLISGPCQSAVICESGRLFVWGDNHYGQLGIGHTQNNGKNSNDDIITKPTCVKALKSLGLKVCDAAYGNNWAVILTHSNEIFYSGRNIFPLSTHVAQHFTTVLIDNEEFSIIRKPFRLEEFDDYLSKSEETDNFVAVLAGNSHFAVLTSTGRLIGCGSNSEMQLGYLGSDYDGHPVEITLDSPVQQFVCGPECTLVLTESGTMFLTGRLNDFVFTKFTVLQKNLSTMEQIIYIHISKTSEIYIVTNVGSIYRSLESLRNKNLVFQRFYDYDSEENGPIWKILKGLSFYAVLSKANKFFTTFSESGHHLKTFREISKFKNLRLLDIAVGDHHILVHGIPRSSTLSATLGPCGEHRFMSQSFVIQSPTPKITEDIIKSLKPERLDNNKNDITKELKVLGKSESGILNNQEQLTNEVDKSNEKFRDEEQAEKLMQEKEREVNEEMLIKKTINTNEENILQNETKEDDNSSVLHHEFTHITSSTRKENRSPSESLASHKSLSSIKFDAISTIKSPPLSSANSDKKLRPYTPYPENGNSNTPNAMNKNLRNFSYEVAMQQDQLDKQSLDLQGTLGAMTKDDQAKLDYEDEPQALTSASTPQLDEDEHLSIEISALKDALDQSKRVNEIRFINNGIDVTQNVEKFMMETPSVDIESLSAKSTSIDATIESEKQLTKESKKISTEIEEKLLETRDSMQSAVRGAAIGARETVDTIGTNAKRIANDALRSVEGVGNNAALVVSNAAKTADETKEAIKQAVGSVSTRISADIKEVKGGISTRLSNEMQDAKQNITTLFQSKTVKEAPVKLSDTKFKDDDFSLKDSIGNKTNTLNWRDDDERTTASVNSIHSFSGNPFEPTADSNHHSGRITERANYVDDLDAVVERSKKAMQDDLRAMEQQVLRPIQKPAEQVGTQEKGRVRQFFDDVRAKGLSCKGERAIQVDDEPQLLQTQHTNNKIHSEISLHNGYNHNNGNPSSSRVCTIL